MMANRRARQSCAARLYSAGISLRRERSPDAPKMTIVHGSAGETDRLGADSTASATSCRGGDMRASVPYFFAAVFTAWAPNLFRMGARNLSAEEAGSGEGNPRHSRR